MKYLKHKHSVELSNGEKVTFEKVERDLFKLTIKKSVVHFDSSDILALGNTCKNVYKCFDSVFFYELTRKIPAYQREVISEMTDEQLLSLAKYYDYEHSIRLKAFTMKIRSELFKRNGLSKATYKLTFKQKAFLLGMGLKRDNGGY